MTGRIGAKAVLAAMLGAALAYGLTEFGMVVTGILLLPKGTLTWGNGWAAARIFTAGFVMAGAAWWLSDRLIIIPILVGAAVYCALILVMQVVPKEDYQVLFRSIQNFFNRQRRPVPEAIG